MSAISSTFEGFNSFTPVVASGPAASYLSAPVAPEDATSSSKKSSGSSSGSSSGKVSIGGLDSNMVDFLMLHGLASDVRAFMTSMKDIIMNAYDPTTGAVNFTAYELMLPRLTLIGQEKLLFDLAMTEARTNNSLGEIAVNSRGEVYYVDPLVGLRTKSASEVTLEDRLLTNGELASMRATNPIASFDMDLTNTIANGVGSSQITEHLLKTINGLGSNHLQVGLYTDVNNEVVLGMQALQASLSGKASKVSVTAENQEEQAAYALRYLIQTLPSNMSAVLKAKAASFGTTETSIINDLLRSQMSTTNDKDTGAASSSSSNNTTSVDDLSKLDMDPVTAFFMGRTPTKEEILNPGTSFAFKGTAHYGLLRTGSDGHVLKPGESLVDVESGPFKGRLDTNNMTFGSLKIENPDAVKILDSSVRSMELPVDLEELNKTGLIKPDLSILPKIEEVNNYITNNHITDLNKIKELYQSKGIPIDDGTGNRYVRFAIITGYADDAAFSDKVDEQFDSTVLEVTSKNKLAMLKRVGGYDNKTYKFPDNIRSGNIYIPIIDSNLGYSNAVLGTYQTSGTDINVRQSTELSELQSASDAKQLFNFKRASLSLFLK